VTTPLHILLVEDHPDSRDLLAFYLRSEGHDVEVAGTVKEGAVALEEQTWDLLMSDVGLPDGSGWDMLQAAGTDRALLAVAMSGYGTWSDRARSRAAGFHEHVTKPVDLSALDRIVARALAAKQAS
jgi:CheY-like chemotaxis protein